MFLDDWSRSVVAFGGRVGDTHPRGRVRRGRVRDTHPPGSRSGHPPADVNCTGCHATNAADDATLAELAAHWIDAPPMAVCVDCQRVQARTFALGRHGMRGHPKIAKPRDPQRALSDLGLEAQRVDHWALRRTPNHPDAEG